MRRLVYIVFTALLLTAMVGCRGAVDKRLVLADTLMWKNPDSSLAILEAINRDSLTRDENRAYHALLLTQAQFRCNGTCQGDSLINFALNHYSDNHNREHYTRSLLYKGSFYEVHNNPSEAIKWYKQAENNADSTDYRNLAQVNMRMGNLYYTNYASNNLDLEKYKKALKYYRFLDDKPMIMISLNSIGNLCRLSDKAKAIKCLEEAKQIATEIKDTVNYYNQLNELSMAYFYDSLYVEAKDAAMECVNNTVPNNAVLFNAANAYAMLGMTDSAFFYLNQTKINKSNLYDKMMHDLSLAYIFKAQGKMEKYYKYYKKGDSIASVIKHNSKSDKIFTVENNEESIHKSQSRKTISKMRNSIILISVIIILLLLTYITNVVIIRRKYLSLVRNTEINKSITENTIKELELKLIENKKTNRTLLSKKTQIENDEFLLKYLHQHFNSLNHLIEESYKQKSSDFIRLFVKNAKQIGENQDFWIAALIIANKRTANLVNDLANKYSTLTESELRLITLICLGYNNDAIAACTGTNKDSVKSKKTKIKSKINAEMQLDAFIKIEISKRNKNKESTTEN